VRREGNLRQPALQLGRRATTMHRERTIEKRLTGNAGKYPATRGLGRASTGSGHVAALTGRLSQAPHLTGNKVEKDLDEGPTGGDSGAGKQTQTWRSGCYL
jgi:hypothetical protein